MKWKGKILGLVIAAFLILISLIHFPQATAPDIPEWDLTIEVAFDPETLNLSEYPPAILFDGWVNFTGYTAVPVNVHLTPSSDLGCVYLSQYDFSFHTPESIPFNGLITNEIEGNFSFYSLTFAGSVEQGGLQYGLSPSTTIIPVYYLIEEDEDIPEPPEPPKSDDFPYFLGLPPLIFCVLYVVIIRPRMIKNGKNGFHTNKNHL
jgi:hypothetical protein